MKNPMMPLLLIGLMILYSVSAFAEQHPELKAFPAAKEGMERFVIVLPHKGREQEISFRVEIFVGREMLVDSVNLVHLANVIEPRILNGWGYTYYEVTGQSVAMSTLMAPPEGAEMVKKFVTAQPLHVPYNSRLPVVVYAPKGFEVHYRIWQASEIVQQADKR